LLACLLCAPFALGAQTPPQSQEEGPIIGIDLGTTYSCVSVYENGSAQIIANDQGNRITPSIVAFSDNGERLVGDAAKNQATINPENTIYDVKRLIGREYSDTSVQEDKKLVPFEIIPDKLGNPRIRITQDGNERIMSPEEISGLVLAKMKSTAEAYLGREINRAVVTVPAYFTQAQREATKDAGRIAGLTVERIINEPTAAAMAYGLDEETSVEDKNVLVFDLGGGTFDVTLLNLDDGVFDVLASEGDTHLGGEDFDQRVMKYFIDTMKRKSKIDISGNKMAIQKLRKEVERVKRALSSQNQARVEIEEIVPGYDLQETLTRARFEELNNDLFKKTLIPVQNVLKRAGLSKSEVDDVVLVGGSTRIPRVQELLSEFFDGKELSKNINPDEAVAFGAGVQAAIIGGYSKNDSILLLDKTSLSMGIETIGGVFTPIVKRDTQIPTKKTQVFSTHQDNQSRVAIDVFEGERSMTKDNHPLGRFELTGIPPAPRGVPQIEVTFQVNADGILEVTAADKGTGKSEKITISADKGRLSEEEIQRMVADAKQYEEEDRIVRERMDARNGLESYLYNLKSHMEDEDRSANLAAEDKRDLLDLMEEKLDWMENNPEASKDEYLDHQKEVEQVANPLIRNLYDNNGDNEDETNFDDL
jgi:heat shock protein 5